MQISPLFKKNFALLQKFGLVFRITFCTFPKHVPTTPSPPSLPLLPLLPLSLLVNLSLRPMCCREKRHPYELLPTSYPLYPWLAPRPEHKPSPFRLSDGQCGETAAPNLAFVVSLFCCLCFSDSAARFNFFPPISLLSLLYISLTECVVSSVYRCVAFLVHCSSFFSISD